jgi:hypothetical protein
MSGLNTSHASGRPQRPAWVRSPGRRGRIHATDGSDLVARCHRGGSLGCVEDISTVRQVSRSGSSADYGPCWTTLSREVGFGRLRPGHSSSRQLIDWTATVPPSCDGLVVAYPMHKWMPGLDSGTGGRSVRVGRTACHGWGQRPVVSALHPQVKPFGRFTAQGVRGSNPLSSTAFQQAKRPEASRAPARQTQQTPIRCRQARQGIRHRRRLARDLRCAAPAPGHVPEPYPLRAPQAPQIDATGRGRDTLCRRPGRSRVRHRRDLGRAARATLYAGRCVARRGTCLFLRG